MASLSSPWLVLLVAMGCTFLAAARGGSRNPTAGFQKVELAAGDFQVQSPFNVPESRRFQYQNGVRTFWVHRNDKPINTSTHTNPRSEVRIRFDGYGYVPSGTSGASVMQIHNQEGAAHATVLMLHVYDGVLRFYSGKAVEADIYNRWFRLNVVHDVRASTVAVYIDGQHKFGTKVTPSDSYYFKFGVYVQHHDQSGCMESRWTNVTLYAKHRV